MKLTLADWCVTPRPQAGFLALASFVTVQAVAGCASEAHDLPDEVSDLRLETICRLIERLAAYDLLSNFVGHHLRRRFDCLRRRGERFTAGDNIIVATGSRSGTGLKEAINELHEQGISFFIVESTPSSFSVRNQ